MRSAPLLGLCLLVAQAPTACTQAPEDRPNIVILVSDDQDYEHFGFAGHPAAHTPTIDSLAEGGVVFTHGFVPMSRCRPAQASLLSGRWPHQSGVYFNVGADFIDAERCIANRLADVGYRTTGEGKFWEKTPRKMGFSNYTIRNYETFVREGQEHLFGWLGENAGEDPLFVWWAPQLPHVPHNPSERLLGLIDPEAIPVPDWYRGDPATYRAAEHRSLAMGAWLDEGIRELTDELRRIGELEDTLFLFLIDNGHANGLPSKGTAFDKGLRTPVVFSWGDGRHAGESFDDLVSTVDLYATLLDYAGAEIPEGTAGTSLRPRIEGEPFEPRDALYGAVYTQTPAEIDARPERDAYGLWARNERWKYVLYLRDVRRSDDPLLKIQADYAPYPERQRGHEDLFLLETDPYELEDLSALPQHEEVKARLRAEALAFWNETGGGPLSLP